MAEHVLAVLVDFENMARPGAKSRGDFDINLVLSRLAEKGRVVVKRAYADWSRYREAKIDLQNAGLELIEMPSAREGAKNRADIKLAVDAMELAYSREHVDNFVIVSGDSDFTPLVGKLRELNKRVVGMGNRESSSELLIANCDEFIFYDSIASSSRRGRGGSRKDPISLLSESLMALQREAVDLPLASVVKDAMRRKDPAFDENALGFSTFSKFLEASAGKAGISLQTDPRSGTYRVSMSDAPAPVAVVGADDDEGTGENRRRRRRGGRGRGSAGADGAGAGERGSRADAAVAAAESGADVFEVFVTPTPDPDLGQLPSLDEPITYEDMVLLTPEVEAEVKAAGVEEDDPDAPPARSTRRRRRRASADADVEGEPTPDDLEAIADEDAAAEEASEVGLAEVGETPTAAEQEKAEEAPAEAAEEEEKATSSRRRVRRSSAAKKADEAAAEAPAEEEKAEEEKAEEAPAEEKPKRRRAPAKKKVAEEAPAEEGAEAPAEEEKPKRRRPPARKKAAEEPAAEDAAAE
jgi:uncharacterized protein (TIGR00288 family)